jgi:uncharacterized protein YqeY
MTIKEQLENALKDAMRANDDVKRRTLRMALASIKMSEIDKGKTLDDPATMTILQKEIKSRNEAIQEARKAHRSDLEEASLAEISVLESFLPVPLTDIELKDAVKSVMAEINAASPSDMGRIIKMVMERYPFRVTGDKVSQAVRSLLQN